MILCDQSGTHVCGPCDRPGLRIRGPRIPTLYVPSGLHCAPGSLARSFLPAFRRGLRDSQVVPWTGETSEKFSENGPIAGSGSDIGPHGRGFPDLELLAILAAR